MPLRTCTRWRAQLSYGVDGGWCTRQGFHGYPAASDGVTATMMSHDTILKRTVTAERISDPEVT